MKGGLALATPHSWAEACVHPHRGHPCSFLRFTCQLHTAGAWKPWRIGLGKHALFSQNLFEINSVSFSICGKGMFTV